MKIIKMNNIKILSIAIVLLLLGAGLVFTKDLGKSKEENVSIRLLDTSTTINPWELVKKLTGRDILEEEGVRVEPISNVQSTGGTTAIQALLAKNIDYAGSAWSAWINTVASGGKVKVVVGSSIASKESPAIAWMVLNDSNIYTAKDFVGKKIGVNVLGAQSDYITREYLRQNGLSINQVQLIVVPSTQLEQVLRSKQVDIAAFSGVNLDMAIENGGLRSLFNTYEFIGDSIYGGSGFREDFIKEHPDTVRRFVTAFEKSKRLVWDEFQKDPERVRKAATEIYKEKGGNPKLGKYYYPNNFALKHPFIVDSDVQWWIDAMERDGSLKPDQTKPFDVYTNEFNPYYTGEIK